MRGCMSPIGAGWYDTGQEILGSDLAAQDEARRIHNKLDREGTFAYDPAAFVVWSRTATERDAIEALVEALDAFVTHQCGRAPRYTVSCAYHDFYPVAGRLTPAAALEALEDFRARYPEYEFGVYDEDDPERGDVQFDLEEIA